MEYTALYRKFRPNRFAAIVGQEHITRTLKNEIIANRVGHAYLFNGGRGTGKTTAAKILARAVNCLNLKDGEPCNECEICKAALDGSLTDIVEMDAASNNSVDDIRAIRDEVNFLPTLAKFRVYIIDEVHMLSSGAFNALLKTLEEPPAHVKFILATTEPQKLPTTILSRCQRFDFKKISEQNLIKGLKKVCDESNINITDEALKIIAIMAEGGMRDALSILERCSQEETNITETIVKDLVGIPKLEIISDLAKAVIEKQTDKSLEIISEIISDGKDIENFLWEYIKYFKDILICKANGNLQLYSKEELDTINELSNNISKEELIYVITELSDLISQIKWSSQKTIMVEVAIIKLCNYTNISSGREQSNNSVNTNELKNIKNKIEALENKINNVKVSNVQNNTISQSNQSQGQVKTEVKKEKRNFVIGEKIKEWPEIIQNIKQSGKMLVYTNLINSTAAQLNDMTVGISFPRGLTPFGKSILEQTENMNEIVKQVSMELGATMRIKLLDCEIIEKKDANKSELEQFSQEVDLPLNIIEE